MRNGAAIAKKKMKMAIAAATAPISGRVNMRAVNERLGRAGSPVLGDSFVAAGVLMDAPWGRSGPGGSRHVAGSP